MAQLGTVFSYGDKQYAATGTRCDVLLFKKMYSILIYVSNVTVSNVLGIL